MSHQKPEREWHQRPPGKPVSDDRGNMVIFLLGQIERNKLIDEQAGYQRPENPFDVHGSLVNQPVTNDITVVSADATSAGSATPPKVPIVHTSKIETAPARAPAPTFRVGIVIPFPQSSYQADDNKG